MSHKQDRLIIASADLALQAPSVQHGITSKKEEQSDDELNLKIQ